MTSRYKIFALLLCLLSLAGCSRLPFLPGGNQPASTTDHEAGLATSVPATRTAEEATVLNAGGETQATTQQAEPGILRIWLPPEFDPAINSPANQLLKARLEEFEAQNPGIKLDVRVKALEGTGGLLDALTSTNAAAPLALPDLILLPRPLLESAALKGLLHPYDGLSGLMDDPGWFEYARQLARLKASTYGIPFAGDAMLMAYDPTRIENPPTSLEDAISLGEVLLFPATDPQSLYTIDTYLSTGANLQDTEGRPYLNKDTLSNILDIYQRASQVGVMPYWLTQYSDDSQAWEALMGGLSPMAITWASTYLDGKQNAPSGMLVAPLPTSDGSPFTLATGWSWALAGQDPEQRALSVQLAEFLVEKEFLSTWTQAAGYLPARVDALGGWQDGDLRQVLEQISYAARLMPAADVLSSVGPPVEQAVVDVLKAQNDPLSAAQAATDRINQP
jgi:multiple sugar transport system substrate-binding protein